jgi:hypothetical protein
MKNIMEVVLALFVYLFVLFDTGKRKNHIKEVTWLDLARTNSSFYLNCDNMKIFYLCQKKKEG